MAIPNNILDLFESIDSYEHRFDKAHALRAVEQIFEGHVPAKERAIRYLSKIGVLEEHAFYLFEQEEDLDDLIDIHRISVEAKIPFHVLKTVFHREVEKTGSKEEAFKNIGKFVKKHLVVSEATDDFKQKLNSIDDSTIEKLASKIKTISDLIDHYNPEEFSYHINEASEDQVWGHIRKLLKKASKRVKLKKKSRPSGIMRKAKAVAKHLLVSHLFHRVEKVDPDVEHEIVKSSAYKKLVSKLSPKISKIEDEAVHQHQEIHEEMEPLEEPVSSMPPDRSPYRYLYTADKDKEMVFDPQTGREIMQSEPGGVIAYLVMDKTNNNIQKDTDEQ